MSQWQVQHAAALRKQLEAMTERDPVSSRDGFDEEFDGLQECDHRTRCSRGEFASGCLGSNASKNRFRDVLPNESTRVVLDALNNRGDGDYINANYVDARRLFGVPFVYIAAQAPLRNTSFDFWRMVFENKCGFVVMLCAELEAGRQKSARYWPDSELPLLQFGLLTVELLSEAVRNDTVHRTFRLTAVGGEERVVQHLQYIRWPDQGIPQTARGLVDIVHALGRSVLSTQGPIVVHCSGGIGRTGVFIGLHVGLSLFQLEQPVSPPAITERLKYCRTGMVQRKDQYLFLCFGLLREMERMVWATRTEVQRQSRATATPDESFDEDQGRAFIAASQVREDAIRTDPPRVADLAAPPRRESHVRDHFVRRDPPSVPRAVSHTDRNSSARSAPRAPFPRPEPQPQRTVPTSDVWGPQASAPPGSLEEKLQQLQFSNRSRRSRPELGRRSDTVPPVPQQQAHAPPRAAPSFASPLPRPPDPAPAPAAASWGRPHDRPWEMDPPPTTTAAEHLDDPEHPRAAPARGEAWADGGLVQSPSAADDATADPAPPRGAPGSELARAMEQFDATVLGRGSSVVRGGADRGLL